MKRNALLPIGLALLLAALTAPDVRADSLRVATLSPEALRHAKERLARGDARLQPAFERLIAEADAALEAGPFSVTNKSEPPPSGDKHDYLSFGPYWWPDTTKADGLPYIRRDGERNPETTTGASDSPRMSRMAGAVETLALAYYFTEEARYAEHAARLLRTWFLDPETKMNPHLEYGQAIPGRVEGRGIGIIDTHRLVPVVEAVELLDGSDVWTAEDREGMEAWFGAYLDWLLTSAKGIAEQRWHNNHGSWYDAQAARFALFAGKPDVARELVKGARRWRIDGHITSDGRQPHELARTRSFDYSTFNLRALVALAEMGEKLDMDVWHYQPDEGGGLRQALDYVAPYADPQQAWPHRQIRPVDWTRLLPLLLAAARAYGDARYDSLAALISDGEDAAAHRAHLLYADVRPDVQATPSAPSDSLLQGLRSGHPRLLFTKEDEARTKTLAETDTLLAALVGEVKRKADLVLDQPVAEYEVIGGRLLSKSREVLEKTLLLQMAYRFTDRADVRQGYRDRAVEELRAAAAFPNWNPGHFLDVAEMTAAFALGYDGLFDALAPDERAFIREAIIEKGLEPGLEQYREPAWWVERRPNNWNQVCNGGLLLGALALADEEPELATDVLRNAKASIPHGMHVYAPDGAYEEGPSYWNYGTTYNAVLIAALQSALGTDWGLLEAEGFDRTGIFRIHTIAPSKRYFNYADADPDAHPSPTLAWLATTFDRPAYADVHRDWVADVLAEQAGQPEEDLFDNHLFPLEVVWYASPGEVAEAELDRAALFRSTGDVVTMRSAWDDPEALYVGFKGGWNLAPHAHLDIGSFVLDWGGLRWAMDLGGDDYNLPHYWDYADGGTRWSYYRLGSLSHNTLAVDGRLQRAGGTAKVTAFAHGPGRTSAVMDLASAYEGQADDVRRGIALLDGRRVLVQDELTLPSDTSTVRWGMVTEADVRLDGASALLRQDGRTLRAEILAPASARFELVSTDPGDPRQRQNEGTRMLATSVGAEGGPDVRLAILLMPVEEGADVPPPPDVRPLSTWGDE